MKRLYLIILICWAVLSVASAQKLTVESMTVAGNDISASQYRVNDLNGQPLLQPRKGVNIMKLSDGTTKKVLVK